MNNRISQREARRLRKRVDQLEREITRQRSQWSQEFVGGVNIASTALEVGTVTAIRTARKLRHAVVVVGDETNNVRFMALPVPDLDE